MPYVILSGSVPANKTGVYMGIFNFFITLPEIMADADAGLDHAPLPQQQPSDGGPAGGACLIVAAILMRQVPKEAACGNVIG